MMVLKLHLAGTSFLHCHCCHSGEAGEETVKGRLVTNRQVVVAVVDYQVVVDQLLKCQD